jgi:putative protease
MAPKKKKAKRKVTKRKIIKRKAIKRKVVRRKPAKKRPVKKRAAAKKRAPAKKLKENVIGKVTHYFPKVRAAVIKMKAALAIGESVKIKGHTTDFTQNVTSMQIDRVDITTAKKGQEIGLLVNSRVRQHDMVYKV